MTALRVSHLSDARQIAKAANTALRKTDPIDVSADQSKLTVDRPVDVTGDVNVSGVVNVSGTQVVSTRDTGWAADTGTALKTANATYTAGATLTFSASYTQSELTAAGTRIAAIEAALQAATQELKALKDLALHHGLAGA